MSNKQPDLYKLVNFISELQQHLQEIRWIDNSNLKSSVSLHSLENRHVALHLVTGISFIEGGIGLEKVQRLCPDGSSGFIFPF